MTSTDWESDDLTHAPEPWDLVVIGGGTAGIVAAKTASRAGASVLLIERARPGGDCLWTGCVPSKTILSAAHAIAARTGPASAQDFTLVMERVRAAIAEIEPIDSPASLREAGVSVLHGDARFLGARAIDVDGRQITFHRAVVATGSAPSVPREVSSVLADATVVTSESIWDLASLPERLLVVGGGTIGCELGQAFARLGSSVTIVESGPRLLPNEDPEAARLITAALEADGICVRTGTEVDREAAGEADVVLVAVGRSPRVEGLNPAEAGIGLTEHGHVAVDRRLRTDNPRIWAAGDVTGHPSFTHVAGVHGSLAATNAVLGLRRTVDLSAMPRVVFTQPELAAVGVDRPDEKHRAHTVTHADVDRAVAEGERSGFSRLVLGRRGRVVGGLVVGPRAGESLAEVTLAVQHALKARHIASAIHPYPTWGDGIWNAALEQLREDLTSPWARRFTRLLLRLRGFGTSERAGSRSRSARGGRRSRR